MYWEMDPVSIPYYTNNIDEIESRHHLLPAQKIRLSDLQSLRANGIAMAIIRAHKWVKGDQYLRRLSNDRSPLEDRKVSRKYRRFSLSLLPQCGHRAGEKIRQSDFAFLLLGE